MASISDITVGGVPLQPATTQAATGSSDIVPSTALTQGSIGEKLTAKPAPSAPDSKLLTPADLQAQINNANIQATSLSAYNINKNNQPMGSSTAALPQTEIGGISSGAPANTVQLNNQPTTQPTDAQKLIIFNEANARAVHHPNTQIGGKVIR